MTMTQKDQILSGDSTEESVITKTTSNANANELIKLIKANGINHELWEDLCLAAATNHGSSPVSFRNRLKENLKTIGISWHSLFCYKQSVKCGYGYAWSTIAATHHQISVVKVNGHYFSAFLTYTV